MFSLQVKWPRHEAEHSPYLLANLRIHGATAPLPHRPPWPAVGQIYFHFHLADNVILNQPVMKLQLLQFLRTLWAIKNVITYHKTKQ